VALTSLGIGAILSFNARNALKSMQQAQMAFGEIDLSATRLDTTIQMATTRFVARMIVARSSVKKLAFAMATNAVMAANKMGRAIVKAVDMSIRALKKLGQFAGRTAKAAGQGFKNLGSAMSNAGAAMRTAGMGMLPVSFALKKGIDTAAGFEHQMSGVRAVLKGVSQEDMEQLTAKAKEMGIKSAFSAQQSAEAMENLARAGFKTNDIMSAIEGTMNAAAAEGMSLADSARIVANNVRAFGLDTGEANRVADVMALTSARTNTTMEELAEGLKNAAPTARNLGMDIEETAAALGLLADTGLQGGRSGTALKNALLKLAKPTAAGTAHMERMGLTMKDAVTGNMLPLNDILLQLQKGMNKTGGSVDRAAAAAELFGLRGIPLTNMLTRLQSQGEGGALTLTELEEQLRNAKGSAEEMAATRLDNVIGQLTLLKSSVQGAAIEMFEGLLGPMKDGLKDFIGDENSGLNGVIFAVQGMKAAGPKAMAVWEKAMEKGVGGPREMAMQFAKAGFTMKESTALTEKLGFKMTPIQQIALGINDAVVWMKQAFQGVLDSVSEFSNWLNEKLGGEGVRKLTTIAIKFLTIAGAITPIVLGVGLFSWVLKSSLLPMIKAVGFALKFAFSPAGFIVLGVIAAIMLLRKEGEDLFDTVRRIGGGIIDFFKNIWDNALKPFIDGFLENFQHAFTLIGEIFTGIGELFSEIIGIFVSDTDEGLGQASGFWKGFGKVVSVVLGATLVIIKAVVDALKQMVKWVSEAIDGFMEFSGLAEKKEARAKTNLAGTVEVAGTFLKVQNIREITQLMGRQQQRQWAAAIAEQMTPEQLAKLDPRVLKEMGPQFINMIKEQFGAKATAEAERKDVVPELKAEIKGDQNIDVKATLCVDKKEMATAVARQKIEILERTGGSKTPWQPMRNLEFQGFDLSTTRG